MKKIIIVFLTLVLLVAFACPFFVSGAQVEYPLPDDTPAETRYSFPVGTTGGGQALAPGEICLLTTILYYIWDVQAPSFTLVYNTAVSVSRNLEKVVDSWLYSASLQVLNVEPVIVPTFIITSLNDGFAAAGLSYRLPYGFYAFNNLPRYSTLNLEKTNVDFFLSLEEYELLTNPNLEEEGKFFTNAINWIRDIFSITRDGFRNINNRVLESFSTVGNQLYSIRDRITDGWQGLRDYFKGIYDESIEVPSFEDDAFKEYDDYIGSLEGTADDLKDTLDSVLQDFTLVVNEFSGALLAFSAIMSAFMNIGFIRTMINFSLALGLCATVLGLVPFVTKRRG